MSGKGMPKTLEEIIKKTEADYDTWENELDKAESELIQCQDKLDSLIPDGQTLSNIFDDFEQIYTKMKEQVTDLEKNYTGNEQEKTTQKMNCGTISDAEKLLNDLREISSNLEKKIQEIEQGKSLIDNDNQ